MINVKLKLVKIVKKMGQKLIWVEIKVGKNAKYMLVKYGSKM